MKISDVKIAVLDNGIDKDITIGSELSIVKSHNYHEDDKKGNLVLHGTFCTIIIGNNCVDSCLYSFQLLNNDGIGNVNDLESAFDWCLMNKIRLVNLSFGTTHFKDKNFIRQVVNQYVNKGLVIVAASANNGYITFPASFSGVIGVKAADKFDIDDESLLCIGVDFVAPSEHKLELAGNDITLPKSNSYAAPFVTAVIGNLISDCPKLKVGQIKKMLFQRFGKKCVQYIPDWIERGCFVRKTLNSRAEVYFDIVSKVDEADTVILFEKSELDSYKDKHVVYLGDEVLKIEKFECFFWSRINREMQIEESREKSDSINIPIIYIEFDKNQDKMWWLTAIKKYFEEDGYNAYTTSSESESVLYDLEYIPFDSAESTSNKILDFLFWQTYYNQSDLIICGIEENELRCNGLVDDVLIRIATNVKKTNVQIYCDRMQITNMEFSILEKKQIREVYDSLILFLTEGCR